MSLSLTNIIRIDLYERFYLKLNKPKLMPSCGCDVMEVKSDAVKNNIE